VSENVSDRQQFFQGLMDRANKLLITDQQWSRLAKVAHSTVSRYRNDIALVDKAHPSTLLKLKSALDTWEEQHWSD
jgi:hypothetical protein